MVGGVNTTWGMVLRVTAFGRLSTTALENAVSVLEIYKASSYFPDNRALKLAMASVVCVFRHPLHLAKVLFLSTEFLSKFSYELVLKGWANSSWKQPSDSVCAFVQIGTVNSPRERALHDRRVLLTIVRVWILWAFFVFFVFAERLNFSHCFIKQSIHFTGAVETHVILRCPSRRPELSGLSSFHFLPFLSLPPSLLYFSSFPFLPKTDQEQEQRPSVGNKTNVLDCHLQLPLLLYAGNTSFQSSLERLPMSQWEEMAYWYSGSWCSYKNYFCYQSLFMISVLNKI